MGENETIPVFPKAGLGLGLTVTNKEDRENAETSGALPERSSTWRDRAQAPHSGTQHSDGVISCWDTHKTAANCVLSTLRYWMPVPSGSLLDGSGSLSLACHSTVPATFARLS